MCSGKNFLEKTAIFGSDFPDQKDQADQTDQLKILRFHEILMYNIIILLYIMICYYELFKHAVKLKKN
jgi:hypothetical protein